MIGELSILTEKTEKWMTENNDETINDKQNNKKSLIQLNHDDNQEEELKGGSFQRVITIITKLIGMCYDQKRKGCFIHEDKLQMLQTMFFSFQLDEILFSLLREICQVFPEEGEDITYNQKRYKKKLEDIIKGIFKLLKCIIHNAPDHQQAIIDNINQYSPYSYLNHLGLIDLFTEIISKNGAFAIENVRYLMEELIMKNFTIDSFKRSFDYLFKDNQEVTSKEVKNTIHILQLLKAFIKQIKENKYLNIIIPTYESIIKEFELMTKMKMHPLSRMNNNANLDKVISDVSQKQSTGNLIQGSMNDKEAQMKKIKMVNLLTRIGFILIKSNESVKGLISRLFSMEFIKDQILRKKNEINNASSYNFSAKETKQYNYFTDTYWKYLYKTKLLYTIYLREIKQSQFVKSKLKELYQMYKQDEELFKKIKESEGEINQTIKNTFYNYFNNGIISSVHFLLKNIKDEMNLQQFNLVLQEIEEGVEDMFKDVSLNSSQTKIKQSMSNVFRFSKDNITITHQQTDTKFEGLISQYNQSKTKTKTDKDQIGIQIVISSSESFIHRIEKITTKYVNKEIKLLARSLKSKINFHRVVQLYINDTLALADDMSDDKGSNFHLFNIFLKFIQENYLSKKYYQQIIFIIELFAHFIEAKAEMLKSQDKGNNVMLRKDFFKRKIRELKDVFGEHCQRLFLHNGSVEVFLKLVCEGNKQFNFEVFPSVLKFFNKVLDGGNTLAQDKFYQLFLFFQNSDNFFYYIKQLFDDDIYINLQNELALTESRSDMDNLSTITSLLRYMQLLTENHYQNLQSFLRDQASNRLSYNFVTILVDYISMLLGKLGNIYETNQQLSRATTKLYYFRLLGVLETMCEFLQGPCEKNQETLINTKIIEFFDKILRETELCSSTIKTEKFQQKQKLFYQLTDYEKSMLIYKISLVLLAIIEGRKTKDAVIRKIFRDFDYKLIYEKMTEINEKITPNQKYFLYSEEIDEYDKEANKQIVAESGFNLYYFFEALQEIETEETEFKKYINLFFKDEHKLSKLEKENLKEIEPNYLAIQKTVKFFKENSINIEIIKDEQVVKVYCPRLPLFKNLSEDMMKTFQDNANRSSIQTKLNSLFIEKPEMYETVKFHEQNYELFSKTGPFKILFIYPKVIQTICIVMGIILNIFIFFGYNVADDLDGKDEVYNVSLFTLSNSDSNKVLGAFGITLMIISIWYVFLFFQSKTPISFHNLEKNYYQDLFNQKAKNMSELEIRRIDSILITTVKDFFNKILIYFLVLKNWVFLYEVIYVIFGLLGLTTHYFFFAFYLTEFIQTQPILRNVLKAVYQPILQLLYIFIFFIILLYFYCLIIFYFFYDIMPPNSCSTIPTCLASVYSNTFTSGGNLGNFIDAYNDGENENSDGDLPRYILDITFTIIMVWLVFQMVSGLILDTFTSLRKDEEDVENDIRNTCFICGLEREKIEKYYIGKEGFSKHLNDHNIASYLFYMFYLEEKDPNEYSGIESYIKNMIDQESIAWFPIGRCIMIEEAENKIKGSLNE